MNRAFHFQGPEDRVATLTFDTPDSRVNVFDQPVLEELREVITELGQRDDIGCLVLLSGKPKTFIVGADIEQIAHVTDPALAEAGARYGQQLFSDWEALPFPTVAAIRGTAVGGGTELALASTYRVCSVRDDIRIGLPETQLGIVPGWGGCTRLPRLIGIAEALGIILAGKTVHPKKALKIGLIDALMPEASFLHHVRDFASARIDQPRKAAGASSLKETLLERNPLGRKVVFDQARKQTLSKTKGQYPAPLRAIEVVREGIENGMQAGFDAEARAIGELAVSPISKNLVHLFHLMEEAKKVDSGIAGRTIEHAAVLGAGVMGGGIAQLLAQKAGVTVRLKDLAAGPLASGVAHAAGLFATAVKRRRLTGTDAKTKLALIQPTTTYDGFFQVDLVIEAIVERLDIKQKVMAELATQVADDTILASNTSSLDIDEIARDTPHPERVVGMHFFNPVHRMPLVEVVVGKRTGAEAIQTIVETSLKLGKTPVVVKSAPGFLVNRLLGFYSSSAFQLLDEGHPIDAIDRAMTDWGMPMGPITLADEVGLDVGVEVAKILAGAFGERLPKVRWIDTVVADPARLGAKTGSGFFFYDDKGKRGEIDPAFYSILGIKLDSDLGNDAERVERMVLPMVNEAARCLEEGVVGSPGELDLAMIFGTGFPPFRGGLCRWADSQGLPVLIERLQHLAAKHGRLFELSEALSAAAASGGFYAHPWR